MHSGFNLLLAVVVFMFATALFEDEEPALRLAMAVLFCILIMR